MKKMGLNADKDTYCTDLAIEKEAGTLDLKKAQYEVTKLDAVNDLSLEQIKFQQEQTLKKQELSMINDNG